MCIHPGISIEILIYNLLYHHINNMILLTKTIAKISDNSIIEYFYFQTGNNIIDMY